MRSSNDGGYSISYFQNKICGQRDRLLFSLPQYRFGEARLEEMHPDRTQREEDGRPNEEAIERRVGMGTKSVRERRMMKKKKKVKHKRGWKTEKINEERKKN